MIAMIIAIAPTIASVGAMVKSFQNGAQIQRSETKIQELHVIINSRFTELLETSKEKAFAEGVKSETDKGKP